MQTRLTVGMTGRRLGSCAFWVEPDEDCGVDVAENKGTASAALDSTARSVDLCSYVLESSAGAEESPVTHVPGNTWVHYHTKLHAKESTKASLFQQA